MSYLSRVVFLVCLSFSGTVLSASSVNSQMVNFANILKELYPKVYSDDDLGQDPAAIKKNVNDLDQVLKSLDGHFGNDNIGLKASYMAMQDHLLETKKSIVAGDYAQVKKQLKTVPSICANCHAQKPFDQQFFNGVERTIFKSDFDFAEFSYVTRDYASAIQYYDRYLTQKGGFRSEEKSTIALQRMLTLYAQIDMDPTRGAQYLNAYLPFLSEYPNLSQNLKSWVKGLDSAATVFERDVIGVSHPLSLSELKKYINKFLKPLEKQNYRIDTEEQKAHYVVLRGMLFDYLSSGPKLDERPFILYWLAMCDKALDYSFYHSMTDIYLKECFQQYPEHIYGKLCKDAYQSQSALS